MLNSVGQQLEFNFTSKRTIDALNFDSGIYQVYVSAKKWKLSAKSIYSLSMLSSLLLLSRCAGIR